MNTIFGYWRCSTDAQDQERQIRSLQDAGCEVLRGIRSQELQIMQIEKNYPNY